MNRAATAPPKRLAYKWNNTGNWLLGLAVGLEHSNPSACGRLQSIAQRSYDLAKAMDSADDELEGIERILLQAGVPLTNDAGRELSTEERVAWLNDDHTRLCALVDQLKAMPGTAAATTLTARLDAEINERVRHQQAVADAFMEMKIRAPIVPLYQAVRLMVQQHQSTTDKLAAARNEVDHLVAALQRADACFKDLAKEESLDADDADWAAIRAALEGICPGLSDPIEHKRDGVEG